mmetsp:Transcript_6310/g.8213  ORF Transcript_6310/g.8213 Transcript_6310/m.8213 type:complete len:96 (-) Transcript_6310:224-511(-)
MDTLVLQEFRKTQIALSRSICLCSMGAAWNKISLRSWYVSRRGIANFRMRYLEQESNAKVTSSSACDQSRDKANPSTLQGCSPSVTANSRTSTPS